MDAFDLIELDSPEVKPKFHKNNGKGDAFDHVDYEGESFWKNAARTALQIPQGFLETTKAGIAGGLWQLLGQGEVEDPEELDRIREISEREGIPFDEEAYKEAGNRALGTLPTVRNAASKIEEKTGLPLEPKTRLQKGLRFLTEATRLSPGKTSHLKGQQYPGTFKGMTAELPRPVLGAGVEAAKEIMQEAGVPEQWAELASFAILKQAPEGGGKLSFTKEKPSGLPERQFENIKEKTEVSPRKLTQINDKLESDFKTISDKIIKESPVGETAENLRNDPTFRHESEQLMEKAQTIADSMPGAIPADFIKQQYAREFKDSIQGFKANEYDIEYAKFMKKAIDNIFTKEVKPGKLIEQYRKNNGDLREYYEPGASKALNRAKKDALLAENRAITKVMEQYYPESELVPVFKEGNARWSKIKDIETIDDLVNSIFPENQKVNFKEINDFFKDKNYRKIFERALGEKGFKDFEQLMKDLSTSEAPYKMLKAAQGKGFFQKFTEGSLAFMIHPWAGKAKVGYDIMKGAYKTAINSVLDKPKLGITWKRAIDELKKGDFAAAEKDFASLEKEIKEVTPEVLPKEAIEHKAPKVEGETIQGKAEKIEPKNEKVSAFKTEKGSTYTVNEDGSTTRNKAYRPEHGKEEQGLQPKSDKTWFVSKEDADKLGEFQSVGQGGKRLIEFPDGRLGIMYDTGKDAGKVEARTVITPETHPKEGLIPVESWEGGKKVHFGNKILEIENKPPELPATPKKAKAAPVEKPKVERKDLRDFYTAGGESTPEYYKTELQNVKNWYEYLKDKHERTSYDPNDYKTPKKARQLISDISIDLDSYERNPKQSLRFSKIKSELKDLAKTQFEEIKTTGKPVEKEVKPKKMTKEEEAHLFGKKKEKATKKPEKVTELPKEKVKEIKHQDISKKGLKEQKHWLIENLDEAIVNAPDPKEIQPPSARKGSKAFAEQLEEYQEKMKKVNETLTFDVPGDGEFKIKNHKKALEQFRASVEKRWPDKPLKDLYPKNKTNPAKKA